MKPPIILSFWKACLFGLLCVACQKELTWSFYVSTYAGGKVYGPLEGHTDSVYFAGPNNIAVDRNGDLFVTDKNSHQVRKIMPGGMVVSFAGRNMGFADGRGSMARFDTPRGLTLDAAGNVYVADSYNHSIRKITSDADVSTLAGDGGPGYADGTGEAARFDTPLGVASDDQGNVYVADSYNNCIRKIAANGRVSTIAGDGTAGFTDGEGGSARFNDPVDVAVDGAGNLYVTDRGNNCIRKITPGGQVSTLAGDGGPGYADGTGEAAQFDSPLGVSSDKSGNVYVGDTGNNRIRKITPNGSVSTIAGDGAAGFADGPGTAAQFNSPWDVAVDPRGEFLFVADRNNRMIRKIDLR